MRFFSSFLPLFVEETARVFVLSPWFPSPVLEGIHTSGLLASRELPEGYQDSWSPAGERKGEIFIKIGELLISEDELNGNVGY